MEISQLRIFAPWRNFASANCHYCEIRSCEFSLLGNFGKTKFRFSGCEILPRWQRNFVWLDESSRALSRRDFVEFSWEQRTKNTEFRLHFFFTELYVHPKNSNHPRSHLRAIMALDQSGLGLENKFLENKSGRIFCVRQVYFIKSCQPIWWRVTSLLYFFYTTSELKQYTMRR